LIQKQGIDGRPVGPWKCARCAQAVASISSPCACAERARCGTCGKAVDADWEHCAACIGGER
jgi:hypothetical protein